MVSRKVEHLISGHQWCPTNLRDGRAENRRNPERQNGDGPIWCTFARYERQSKAFLLPGKG